MTNEHIMIIILCIVAVIVLYLGGMFSYGISKSEADKLCKDNGFKKVLEIKGDHITCEK